METLTDKYRCLVAVCEGIADVAVRAGDDSTAYRYMLLVEAFGDVLKALESYDDAEQVMELMQ